MAKVNISKRTVDAAKPAEARTIKGKDGTERTAVPDNFIWDTSLSGFGLKVTPAGRKVYVYQYRLAPPGKADRTPAKRYTIGKHGALTPDQARKRAEQLAGMVANGIDPREAEMEQHAAEMDAKRAAAEKERLENELAFTVVAGRWLDQYEHEKGRRPSSVRQAKLVIENHLKPALESKPLPHIGRAELQPIIDAIPARQKGMRRAVFAYASILFGWAAKRGMIDANPLSTMERPSPPPARSRVLTDSELSDTYLAATGMEAPFGPFFQMLILTGQRRSEVAGIAWGELDRDEATWTIPPERAKNKAAHIVPLSPAVVGLLDGLAGVQDVHEPKWPSAGLILSTNGRTPISGITKAKQRLDTAIAKRRDGETLSDWRIHDLRRTLATGLQRLGIRFEVTEAVLNHVSGAKSGVAGVYQQHDWKEEKRSALDAWARHVAAIAAPAERENVVPLGAAKRSA